MDGKDAPRWRLLRQGQGYTPGSGADEQRGCTPPSVCTHTESKTLVWTPQERNPNITPAPSTDTCGQCHSTDKRGAGGRDRHRASQRTTQTQNHPMALPSAGRGRGQKRRTRPDTRNRPRQFPVRTHIPKIQNTLRPYMIYIRTQPPMGGCAGSSDLSAFQNWESPASAGAAENARLRTCKHSWAGVCHSISQRPVHLRQKHSSTPMISFHIYPSRTPESL